MEYILMMITWLGFYILLGNLADSKYEWLFDIVASLFTIWSLFSLYYLVGGI